MAFLRSEYTILLTNCNYSNIMFLIDDILVSDDILERKFCCDIQACKGACCVEGAFGAPLEEEEREVLRKILPVVRPLLDESSRQTVDEQGTDTYYPGMNDYGTTLRPDGACALAVFDENGMASCGVEKAWEAGNTDFRKPLSCQLYPIRVFKNRELGYTALNFDEWEICKPAVKKGNELGLPVLFFLKDALVRGYGTAFFEALEAAWRHKQEKSDKT